MSILFLHGLGQNSSAWDKTLAYLPEMSVLCPDLSTFLDGTVVTYAMLYRAFSQFCSTLEKPLTLVGLSLGAVLALNYAADHPADVSAMVLAAPQYEMPKTLLKFQNLLFRCLPDQAFGDTGLSKQDFISLTNSMTELNFTGSLETLVCPVTVVCGERDRANRQASVKLAKLLPNADFMSVKGAGHEVNLDAPEALADILAAFLH